MITFKSCLKVDQVMSINYTKILFSLFSSITLIFISSNKVYASTDSVSTAAQESQTFYHQPYFAKFIRITTGESVNNPRPDLSLIFSTMVVDKHPDYLKKISENFSKYSSEEKQLLFSTLIATGNVKALNKQDQHYAAITAPNFTPKAIKSLEVNDSPDNLDRIWAAYFATGDDKYLQKIIQYINSNDFLLIISYEIVNRNFLCNIVKHSDNQRADNPVCQTRDIINSIKQKYPKNAEKMHFKAVVMASALWSLESNRRQDHLIDNKIKLIVKNNQNLDYWKKINTALHK